MIWQWYVVIIPINLQMECTIIKQLQIQMHALRTTNWSNTMIQRLPGKSKRINSFLRKRENSLILTWLSLFVEHTVTIARNFFLLKTSEKFHLDQAKISGQQLPSCTEWRVLPLLKQQRWCDHLHESELEQVDTTALLNVFIWPEFTACGRPVCITLSPYQTLT